MGKPKLGSGERFAALKSSIAAKGKVRDPGAVAAAIGRKKYGAKRFAKLSAAGRRDHGFYEHTDTVSMRKGDVIKTSVTQDL